MMLVVIKFLTNMYANKIKDITGQRSVLGFNMKKTSQLNTNTKTMTKEV